MSVDLREIAIKTEEINKDFSEALEILKELFKNGVKNQAMKVLKML
ncbi:hypothetical protein OLU60_08030 [Campylobacter jejuni]|nr:hypothetical protein [Campylobacter jejuni]